MRRAPAAPDPELAAAAAAADQRIVELGTFVKTMGDVIASRQTELARHVNERLDAVSHRLGESMQTTTKHTVENLAKLNERLAVIDNAQKNITDLASQVTSLQNVLSNKQTRGAFGQGRMEVDHPGRPAEKRLRISTHAQERQAARLRGVPARSAAAGDRRQISARSRHRVARGQDRRRTQDPPRHACART